MPCERDPFVVSKATCGGCIYYRYLGGAGIKACHYTLETGKIRPLDMKCADCTYKTIKKRNANLHSSRGGKNRKGIKR